jgi:hypothetical protein
MANVEEPLIAVASAAKETVSTLYDTISAIPSPPQDLMRELLAAITLLKKADEFSNVNLDPNILKLVRSIDKYCTAVNISMQHFSSSKDHDWTTFEHDGSNFTVIAHKLQMRTSSIYVGGIVELQYVLPSSRSSTHAKLKQVGRFVDNPTSNANGTSTYRPGSERIQSRTVGRSLS